MNRFSTALTIIAVSILLARCTAKKTTKSTPDTPTVVITMTPEEAVADVKNRYTEAQMEEGNVIFRDNCGKCHKLHEPETRTVEKWEKILPRMNKKSGLDAEQGGKVRAYVLAHATLQ